MRRRGVRASSEIGTLASAARGSPLPALGRSSPSSRIWAEGRAAWAGSFIAGGAGSIAVDLVHAAARSVRTRRRRVQQPSPRARRRSWPTSSMTSACSWWFGDFDKDAETKSRRRWPAANRVHHFAANPYIARAVTEPAIDLLRQGTDLTNNVIDAMRINGVGRITYASGSGVYGDRGTDVLDESSGPLIPLSTYGASKLGCEAMLAAYAHTSRHRRGGLRFANVVGDRQTHGVTFNFVRRLLRGPDAPADPWRRNQSKSYIHVGDVVAAMLLLNDQGWSGFEVFNAGTGDYITVTEIADLVVERMGRRRQLRLRRRQSRLEGRCADRALQQRQAADPWVALRARLARGADRLDRRQHSRGPSGARSVSSPAPLLGRRLRPSHTASERRSFGNLGSLSL